MKRAVVILLVVFALSLAGCGARVTEGIVIDKTHKPATKAYVPIIIRTGKVTRIIPRWLHYSEKWYVTLSKDEQSETWQVSEEYYNSVEVGEYAIAPGCTPLPEPPKEGT